MSTPPCPAPSVDGRPDGDLDDGGLVHLGVIYDDVDDLVRRCLPEIRAVLDDGGEVHIACDDRGAAGFRAALGDDADRVSFPRPHEAMDVPVAEFGHTLRGWLRGGRRTLVLGQYLPEISAAWDCAEAEDTVSLVFADQPLTVVCACPRTGRPEHRALTSRSHRHLLGPAGRTANPHHRPARAARPAPLTPWGPPVAVAVLRASTDLASLRRRVAGVARRAGLSGPAGHAAVLAVHEAVLLADGAGLEEPPRFDGGALEVDLRAVDGTLVAEARAAGEGPAWDADDDLRRRSLAGLCDRVAVDDDPAGRRVRVVCTTRGAFGRAPADPGDPRRTCSADAGRL